MRALLSWEKFAVHASFGRRGLSTDEENEEAVREWPGRKCIGSVGMISRYVSCAIVVVPQRLLWTALRRSYRLSLRLRRDW